MLSHDGLNRLCGQLGIIKRYGRDVMMQNMRLDDAMEDVAADKTEFAVDCGRSAAGEGPGGVVISRG